MITTRFAPSPTGFLHVGNLRTALYSYLVARQNKGRFIFRLEDTDRTRFVEGATENLIEILHWAGLKFDEGPGIGGPNGPYIQSERTEIYQKHAAELIKLGHAYNCFCTSDRLDAMRKEQEAHKQAPKYDRTCVRLSDAEIQEKLEQKVPHVVRLKVPEDRTVTWIDLVRGEVSFEAATIDDQVLMKSDGYPTYHLANIVDDHMMEVTHVVRGEEWLSSTPKHLLLYEAFGWKPPHFAHLPLFLNKDRSKMSKRQGDVAAEDYRKKGYLPEALLNFVALLGWHPGGDETQEIFTLDELITKFSFDKVHKGGAVFDLEKLDWVNWQWRKKKFDAAPGTREEKLYALAAEFLPAEYKSDRAFLDRCLTTIEEKVIKNPAETPMHLGFYFKEDIVVDRAVLENPKMKVDSEIAKTALTEGEKALREFASFDDQDKLKAFLLELVTKLGLKNGQVFWPLRVALTGEAFSPGVFEVLWALGKEKSLTRLISCIAGLSK